MALFSRKTEDTAKAQKGASADGEAVKQETAKPAPTALPTDRDLSAVIVKPHITEKAVRQGEKNVYTFVVHKDATKYDVADAVKELFKVTPIKVNIVNKSPRSHMSRSRGRRVSQKGQKKAYVYLQAGDSIELA